MTAEIIQNEMMTEREARACVECIRAGLEDIRKDVLDLYERQGWCSLGYSSWRECVTAEFGQSQRTLYNALEAGKVDRVLQDLQNDKPIPYTQAHELTPVVEKDPEVAREIWRDINEQHNGHVTASKLREAVKEHFAEDVDDEDGWEPDARIDEFKSAIRILERCQKMRNDVFATAFRSLAAESRKVLRDMEAREGR